MKKISLMLIIVLISSSMFAILTQRAMGWASSIPWPLHSSMAYDALRGTGWTNFDAVEIARHAGVEEYVYYYHRVEQYQTELLSYMCGNCGVCEECKDKGTLGGAEHGAEYHIEEAGRFYAAGNVDQARDHLGYAIHFIQDAACPPHVFPFQEGNLRAAFNFEFYTAWYDPESNLPYYYTKGWSALVRGESVWNIESPEDLRNKVVELSGLVRNLQCSYVRQHDCDPLCKLLGQCPKIGDPSSLSEWDMSDVDVGFCMQMAARLIKGAARWVRNYETIEPVDVVLVIDRSGSMGGSKIRDAKVSANLFTDLMHTGDYIGVVSYSNGPRVDYQLSEIISDDVKTAVKNRINQIYASGMTAMGDGLRAAYNQLVNYGDPSHPWAIVLMSNGWHNWGREHPYHVVPDLKTRHIKVYTIGLGGGADGGLLGNIATETEGFYRFAATSTDLLAIYHDIATTVTQEQTVSSFLSEITQGETTQLNTIIDSSVVQGTFSISWSGSDLDLTLIQPDGTLIDPNVANTDPNVEYLEETRYEMYRIKYPMTGVWTMTVTGVSVPVGGEDFVAKLTVVADVTLALSTDSESYTYPQPVKILAAIEDWGTPIRGASVEASIIRPDNLQIGIILYDDGIEVHGDEVADDGVYTNYFGFYSEDGSYTISVTATGISSTDEAFGRQAQKTVLVSGVPTDITPPQTTLFIGSPQYTDAVGNIYITSDTPIIVTAVDNNGVGSGVADTRYRVYNATYNTGWIVSVPPITFHLTGLGDGSYSVEYYSTDNVGNVEAANTAALILDNTGPLITVSNPPAGWALQDGVTFMGSIVDSGSGVFFMSFSIREANGGDGIPIGFEDLPASYDSSTGEWSFSFDTLLVPDGYYVLYIEAEDNLGNEASKTVPYSIRNWAVIELLPSSENNKAGRTTPVKFALRVVAEVDPNQPFVYNEELRIEIFATADPENTLQESHYGDTARDYRISSVLYITNFKTIKRTPMEYTVAIYRDTFDVGSFTFDTVK